MNEPELIEFKTFADARGLLTKLLPGDRVTGELMIRDLFLSSSKRDVVRGFHFHNTIHQHYKFVTVLRGSANDFVIDLRQGSRTYGAIQMRNLTPASGVLCIPVGFGHGFHSLVDETQLLYATTYSHDSERDLGVSMFGLGLPLPVTPIVSERDRNWASMVDFASPFTVEFAPLEQL